MHEYSNGMPPIFFMILNLKAGIIFTTGKEIDFINIQKVFE